jgi:hypothetical protein
MIPLSAVSGTLQFSKTSQRNYELKLNGEVVGTLSRPSLWSHKFVAESQDGRWIIRRSGFFATEIVDAESERQIAFCKWNWCDKGQVTFADGERYQVGPEGFWRVPFGLWPGKTAKSFCSSADAKRPPTYRPIPCCPADASLC